MAIRLVEAGCTVSHKELTEIQREAGSGPGYVRVNIRGRSVDGELKLTMSNGHNEQLGLFYIKSDETSHQGRVVAFEVDRSVRIMSDVWADLTYAVVYEPTRQHTGVYSTETVDYKTMEKGPKGPCGLFRRILIYSSDMSGPGSTEIRAEIDASPELLEIYEVWKAGRTWRSNELNYNKRERQIQEARQVVAKDRWVRVTRGRKVPQGTEGLVFWKGDSQWGTKVGIALPSGRDEEGNPIFRKTTRTGRYGKSYESYKDIAWTYVKNVDVISGLGGRIL